MTSVHANRSLQNLRADKLIDLRNRRLRIVDPGALRRLGDFGAAYMHFGDAVPEAPGGA